VVYEPEAGFLQAADCARRDVSAWFAHHSGYSLAELQWLPQDLLSTSAKAIRAFGSPAR
jgi:hypothetical protein